MNAVRKSTINMSITPLLCGSAFKNKGVQTMLDAVMAYLPSPMDIEAVAGTDPDSGEEILRKPSRGRSRWPAWPSRSPPIRYVGRLAFFRCYSGSVPAGSYVQNMRTGNKERISRIFQMHANKQNSVEVIEAGDIGAAVGFKDIRTGDTLCDENKQIILESMSFPEPVIGIAVEPKTQADMDKMGQALYKLAEEDPTFRVHTDDETGQTVISGMGELHLEIIVDRMRASSRWSATRVLPR
jgi:elongation factor G